jgi:hypothetical protein
VTRSSKRQEAEDALFDDDDPGPKRRKLCQEAEEAIAENDPGHTSSSSKRWPKLSFELDSKVRGRHAAELLLELPYSANKGCMFGLIIEATKVG